MSSEFKLAAGEEYIELFKLLKHLGWSETGGQAKMMIEAGEVCVDGVTETRKRCKLRRNQTIACGGNSVTIS